MDLLHGVGEPELATTCTLYMSQAVVSPRREGVEHCSYVTRSFMMYTFCFLMVAQEDCHLFSVDASLYTGHIDSQIQLSF